MTALQFEILEQINKLAASSSGLLPFSYEGEYDQTKAYDAGDVVTDSSTGQLYRAKQSVAANTHGTQAKFPKYVYGIDAGTESTNATVTITVPPNKVAVGDLILIGMWGVTSTPTTPDFTSIAGITLGSNLYGNGFYKYATSTDVSSGFTVSAPVNSGHIAVRVYRDVSAFDTSRYDIYSLGVSNRLSSVPGGAGPSILPRREVHFASFYAQSVSWYSGSVWIEQPVDNILGNPTTGSGFDQYSFDVARSNSAIRPPFKAGAKDTTTAFYDMIFYPEGTQANLNATYWEKVSWSSLLPAFDLSNNLGAYSRYLQYKKGDIVTWRGRTFRALADLPADSHHKSARFIGSWSNDETGISDQDWLGPARSVLPGDLLVGTTFNAMSSANEGWTYIGGVTAPSQSYSAPTWIRRATARDYLYGIKLNASNSDMLNVRAYRGIDYAFYDSNRTTDTKSSTSGTAHAIAQSAIFAKGHVPEAIEVIRAYVNQATNSPYTLSSTLPVENLTMSGQVDKDIVGWDRRHSGFLTRKAAETVTYSRSLSASYFMLFLPSSDDAEPDSLKWKEELSVVRGEVIGQSNVTMSSAYATSSNYLSVPSLAGPFVEFIAPPSGNVIVTLTGVPHRTSQAIGTWGLAIDDVPVIGSDIAIGTDGVDLSVASVPIPLQGLEPGLLYTVRWAVRSLSSSYSFGLAAPVIGSPSVGTSSSMVVTAA